MTNRQQQDIIKLQQLELLNAVADKDKTASSVTDNASDTPWYLQLLLGFSGVLASVFLIGFLSLILNEIGVTDSPIALFITGVILSGGAVFAFYQSNIQRSSFLTSLIFAISIAGQLYMTFALFIGDIYHPLNVWLFLLLQLIMTMIMPNFMYRLLSIFAALGSLVYLLNFYHAPEISLGLMAFITVVTTLQRYELVSHANKRWQDVLLDVSKAAGYASAVMLLIISVYFIASDYGYFFNDRFYYDYYLAQGLLILTALYAAYLILRRYGVRLLSLSGLWVAAAIVIVGVVSLYVSGLLASCLIVIIAVANSQRVLLGLGIIALVSYIFWYYYQLDTSLLTKSASMLIVGIVLLLLRLGIKQFAVPHNDVVSVVTRHQEGK